MARSWLCVVSLSIHIMPFEIVIGDRYMRCSQMTWHHVPKSRQLLLLLLVVVFSNLTAPQASRIQKQTGQISSAFFFRLFSCCQIHLISRNHPAIMHLQQFEGWRLRRSIRPCLSAGLFLAIRMAILTRDKNVNITRPGGAPISTRGCC